MTPPCPTPNLTVSLGLFPNSELTLNRDKLLYFVYLTQSKMTKTKKSRTLTLKDNEIQCFKCEEQCVHEMQYKTPGEEPIECDTCQRWFHRQCLDQAVTNKDWASLTGENQSIMFKCSTCVQGKGEKISELREIKKMIFANNELIKNLEKGMNEKINKQINSKLAEVNSKQSDFEKRMNETEKKNDERFSKLENELKGIQPNINQETNKDQVQLQSMIHEIKDTEINMERKIKDEVRIYMDQQQEKDKRKMNLIIHRLEESQDNDEDQCKRDKADVLKIIATTNPELISELQDHLLEGKKIFRLGTRDAASAKPRPIKVVLPDEEIKIDIFKGCQNLKDSPFNHVSIQSDLTKTEQEANFKLRKECRERKAQGEEVCIYRGKIIPEAERPAKKLKK